MRTEIFQQARFLILDDEPANVLILTQMLEEWGASNICGLTDPRAMMEQFHAFQPDIILLDLMMPGMDGFQVMDLLEPFISPEIFLPILVLTADPTYETKRRALERGAADFLTKPFDAVELSLRIQHLLSRRFLHRRLQNQNHILDQKVQERTGQLKQAEIDTVECLALAAEYRDDDTGQHTQRVGQMSALLAQALGRDEEQIMLLRRAAPLHDVGKIGIADNILLKPGKLTFEEFEMMKTHTVIGAAIMARHHTSLLQLASSIALAHHERWDGKGYPHGLSGEAIPWEGRIVAVADVFDALTHERPYKKAWPREEAISEIARQSGSQFDPAIVSAFVALPNASLV